MNRKPYLDLGGVRAVQAKHGRPLALSREAARAVFAVPPDVCLGLGYVDDEGECSFAVGEGKPTVPARRGELAALGRSPPEPHAYPRESTSIGPAHLALDEPGLWSSECPRGGRRGSRRWRRRGGSTRAWRRGRSGGRGRGGRRGCSGRRGRSTRRGYGRGRAGGGLPIPVAARAAREDQAEHGERSEPAHHVSHSHRSHPTRLGSGAEAASDGAPSCASSAVRALSGEGGVRASWAYRTVGRSAGSAGRRISMPVTSAPSTSIMVAESRSAVKPPSPYQPM